jgi:hypothetical protein
MLKQDVIKHFKTASNVSRALEISPAAVSKWGPVVPKLSAEELERITGGALRVRADLYVRGRPISIVQSNAAA